MAGLIDENDGDTESADAAAVRQMQEEIANATKGLDPEEEPEDPEDHQQLEESSDEEDDDEEDEPDVRQSRAERRRSRYTDLIAENAALKERAQNFQSLYEQGKAPSQATAPDPDGVDAEDQKLHEEKDNLYQEFIARKDDLTADQIAGFKRRNMLIEQTLRDNAATRVMRREFPRQQEQAAMEQRRQELQQRYGDIYSHKNSASALMYAKGIYQQKVAETQFSGTNKSPDELMDEAMNATRQKFAIGGRKPAASAATKAKYARPKETPGGQETQGSRTIDVKMPPEFRRMARVYGGHLKTEKEQMEHWAKGPGRELVAELRKGRR